MLLRRETQAPHDLHTRRCVSALEKSLMASCGIVHAVFDVLERRLPHCWPIGFGDTAPGTRPGNAAATFTVQAPRAGSRIHAYAAAPATCPSQLQVFGAVLAPRHCPVTDVPLHLVAPITYPLRKDRGPVSSRKLCYRMVARHPQAAPPTTASATYLPVK